MLDWQCYEPLGFVFAAIGSCCRPFCYCFVGGAQSDANQFIPSLCPEIRSSGCLETRDSEARIYRFVRYPSPGLGAPTSAQIVVSQADSAEIKMNDANRSGERSIWPESISSE